MLLYWMISYCLIWNHFIIMIQRTLWISSIVLDDVTWLTMLIRTLLYYSTILLLQKQLLSLLLLLYFYTYFVLSSVKPAWVQFPWTTKRTWISTTFVGPLGADFDASWRLPCGIGIHDSARLSCQCSVGGLVGFGWKSSEFRFWQWGKRWNKNMETCYLSKCWTGEIRNRNDLYLGNMKNYRQILKSEGCHVSNHQCEA